MNGLAIGDAHAETDASPHGARHHDEGGSLTPSTWLPWGWFSSRREERLKAKVRALRIKVDVLQLENEHLAELNENLRRWLLANTAAAIHAAAVVGVADPKPSEAQRRGKG